jgi:hypothetical protein
MLKEKSENLVVIIGNGFDLAHGLKTGFSHFAEHYLNKIISNDIIENLDDSKRLKNNFKKKVSNIKIESEHSVIKSFNKSNHLNIAMFNDKPELIDYDNFTEVVANKELKEIKKIIKDKPSVFAKVLTNSFFGKLYSNSYSNWFDIEQAYYKELTEILNWKKNQILPSFTKKEKTTKEKLQELNNEFEEVKLEFKKYLENIVIINEDNNVYHSLSNHFKNRKNVTFINFNYTNTISSYFRLRHDNELDIENIKNIFIHGNLNREIIFGYGDDTNAEYKRMKNSKEKEYIRNFKTFYYLKSTDYRKVLNELETKDNYDTLIIGHSLDTTDKTILKKILDTEKCDYIELLKRSDLKTKKEKEEAQFELHANLSRIFDYETDLRDKLIPFDWSVNFPIMDGNDTSTIYDREKKLYIKEEVFRMGEPGVY